MISESLERPLEVSLRMKNLCPCFFVKKVSKGKEESQGMRFQRFDIPICVQHLAILVDADHLAVHGDRIYTDLLRIPTKGVWDP